jgi:hypothetical protein
MAFLCIASVVLVTLVAVWGGGWIMRRWMPDVITGQLFAMILRGAVALILVIGVSQAPLAHKGAMIFAVGATYFAAVLLESYQLCSRETNE